MTAVDSTVVHGLAVEILAGQGTAVAMGRGDVVLRFHSTTQHHWMVGVGGVPTSPTPLSD